jgi:hypothetical protein
MKSFRLWFWVSVVVIGAVAIAAGYRAVSLWRYPLESGQWDLAPDGRFEARASNMTDESFSEAGRRASGRLKAAKRP